jgi:hypothetical protein
VNFSIQFLFGQFLNSSRTQANQLNVGKFMEAKNRKRTWLFRCLRKLGGKDAELTFEIC